MLDGRRRLLTAALGFAALRAAPRDAALDALKIWLDSWRGIGAVATGMHRQGWDLQLTEYGDGHWRATFYVTGMAHSIVGWLGMGADAVAGGAAAAWEALKKAESR